MAAICAGEAGASAIRCLVLKSLCICFINQHWVSSLFSSILKTLTSNKPWHVLLANRRRLSPWTFFCFLRSSNEVFKAPLFVDICKLLFVLAKKLELSCEHMIAELFYLRHILNFELVRQQINPNPESKRQLFYFFPSFNWLNVDQLLLNQHFKLKLETQVYSDTCEDRGPVF